MLGDGWRCGTFAAVVTFSVNWLVACAPHSLVIPKHVPRQILSKPELWKPTELDTCPNLAKLCMTRLGCG